MWMPPWKFLLVCYKQTPVLMTCACHPFALVPPRQLLEIRSPSSLEEDGGKAWLYSLALPSRPQTDSWKWPNSHLQPNRLNSVPELCFLKRTCYSSWYQLGGSRYPGILCCRKEASSLEILKLLCNVWLFHLWKMVWQFLPATADDLWEPNLSPIRVLIIQHWAKVNPSNKVYLLHSASSSQFHHYLNITEPQPSLLVYHSVCHTHLSKLYFDSLKYPQDGTASKGRSEDIYKMLLRGPKFKRMKYNSALIKTSFFLMHTHHGDIPF